MNPQEQAPQESIVDRTERRLQEIDGTTLTPLVRDALGRKAVQVVDWEHQALRGGAGLGGSVHRFSGTAQEGDQVVPWSLILKVHRAPAYTHDARAVFDQAEPCSPFYWKREPLAYDSGMLQDLPGGLCAPRCYRVTETPDEAIWLWLEDIEDLFEGRWPLEHYGVVARHLGQLNGAYLAGRPMPAVPWMCQGFLRTYVEQAAPVYARLRTSLDRRLVRRLLPGDRAAKLFALWEARETYLQVLDRLPQVFCHLDAFRRNLFARRTPEGSEQTVAVDWSYVGFGALGEELVPLVEASIIFREVELSQAQALYEIALEGYLEGLRDAGWRGDPRLVQLGYKAAANLRYGLAAYAEFLVNLLDDNLARSSQVFGLSPEQLVDWGAALSAQVAPLREGVPELMAILDQGVPGR
jgi:hypothetical protein